MTSAPTATRSFPPQPESVAKAREFVLRRTLGAPHETRGELALMVSELATNAVLHGSGPFVVTVECKPCEVVVSVTDHGSGRALLRPSGRLQPRGRGLRIVDALSHEWGTERSPSDETVVWFRRKLAKQAAG